MCSGIGLKNKFPCLYALETNKNASFSDIGVASMVFGLVYGLGESINEVYLSLT